MNRGYSRTKQGPGTRTEQTRTPRIIIRSTSWISSVELSRASVADPTTARHGLLGDHASDPGRLHRYPQNLAIAYHNKAMIHGMWSAAAAVDDSSKHLAVEDKALCGSSVTTAVASRKDSKRNAGLTSGTLPSAPPFSAALGLSGSEEGSNSPFGCFSLIPRAFGNWARRT